MIEAFLDVDDLALVFRQQVHDFLEAGWIPFTEYLVNQTVDIQAEFMDPHRPAQRFLHRTMEQAEGQAELDREKLELGDFPRAPGGPPLAFPERDGAEMERFDFSRADYRILIALREDYLAHLEGLKQAMPSVTQNRMRLARMTGVQALAAVTGPGRGLVKEEVARQIVGFVSGAADLATAEAEPSLLSLVCRELNETRRARGHTEISADLLAGSRDTILTEFYERTLADQPAGVRAFIEDELLTDSGYRESIAEERVKKGFITAGGSVESLATLIDRRLLRVEERLDVRRVELTHDVLVGVVKASRDLRHERDSKAAIERQLVETQAKEAAGRRSLRRARMIAVGCVALAVGAIGAAGWGFVNLRRAEAAENHVTLERDRAQQARAEAERLVSFLLDDLYTQLEPTGRIEIVSGLARRALGYFDALPKEFRDTRSDRYRAIALGRLGQALSLKGKTLEAEAPLREAEQLLRVPMDKGERSVDVIVELVGVLRQQSRNAYLQNRPQPAIDIARRSVELIAPVAGATGASREARLEFGRAQMNLGFVLMRDRQNPLALASLEQSRAVFQQLMGEPEVRQRACVMYGECAAWLVELLRLLGRGVEVPALLDEALTVADEAVRKEAGNLGALRSRALLRSRRSQVALDTYDFATAEVTGQSVVEDWTEFLRFDADNDTARNNRRVAQGLVSQAAWRQGRLDQAIELTKAAVRETVALGGSPSTIRGSAFQNQRVDNLEAELGRLSDINATLADGNRMREMAASQVDPESYFRTMTPIWNEAVRADVQNRIGQTAVALTAARAVEDKLRTLQPKSGVEQAAQRGLAQNNYYVQIRACLTLRQWADAARAAKAFVEGRPFADDTSEDALDRLASDRALAAVALARAGEAAAARELWTAAVEFNRHRRSAGANDHATRFDSAMLALGQGLLASAAAEKRAAYTAGLAEIAAMPPQPQQLRFVRELKATLEQELAQTN